MRITSYLLPVLIFLFFSQSLYAQGKVDNKQSYMSIGNFKLESGETIYDCQIGYRTYGKLNLDKSNVIIFPTWFTGTSKNLEDIVPGKLIDTASFYVILIDALGNGCSSSPDNSKKQSHLKFPVFTIRDMVESQFQMLTEKMNIRHLVAVAGISMGGMQSFQWAISHPNYMDKVIPIVGTPQLSSSDLLLWNGELQAIKNDPSYHKGEYKERPSLNIVTIIHNLAMSTPEYVSTKISRDSFNTWFSNIENVKDFDWNNWHRQLEAMISHDITKATRGSFEEAAKIIKAKMLIIVCKQDQMVNPMPAIKFARLVNAKLNILESECGHVAVSCEMDKISNAVHEFLVR